MSKIEVVNESTGDIICNSCDVADNFLKRFIGLMGKKELKDGEGLLIKPCKSVHMFFMRFKIDIIFLDHDLKVIKIIEGLKSWNISPYVKESYYVLELPHDIISNKDINIGNILKLSPL